MESIGIERFIAISTDNTGNTRVAREILASRLPNILNLPDPIHHLNNTLKDISALTYFTIVRHFGSYRLLLIKKIDYTTHACHHSLFQEIRSFQISTPRSTTSTKSGPWSRKCWKNSLRNAHLVINFSQAMFSCNKGIMYFRPDHYPSSSHFFL
jgi:hypothetical protein